MQFFTPLVVVGCLLCHALIFASAQQPTGERIEGDVEVADVVVRGPDWEWGNQDGGGGSEETDAQAQGIVVEILAWKGEVDPMKFGVRVVWMNGDSNIYRWGAMDKFDVQVVGRVSKETATEMRERYYEKEQAKQVYQNLPIPDFERRVLSEIFNKSGGTTGAWRQSQGWPWATGSNADNASAATHPQSSSDPCVDGDWDGVVCENGHVVALDLANNGLRGRLADLPINHLPELRSLNLAENQLTGPIPPQLAYLAELRFLALHHNYLTSYIPQHLDRLSKLEWLSLE